MKGNETDVQPLTPEPWGSLSHFALASTERWDLDFLVALHSLHQ